MVLYPEPHWTTQAEITCVVGVKDKCWRHVRRWYESLCRQTVPANVVVVDYGSRPVYLNWERRLFANGWTQLVEVTRDTEHWREGRALNIGIRHSQTPYVFTTNADLILAPNFVEAVLRILKSKERVLVLSDRVDLDVNGKVVGVAPNCFYGTCLGARRKWFEDVHGFDERYSGWGFVDMDLANRARDSGLAPESIGPLARHQFHRHILQASPRMKQAWAWATEALDENRMIYYESKDLLRNRGGWGEL